MRCPAADLVVELGVALPDGRSVLISGMPDFPTVETAAIATDNFGREDGIGFVLAACLSPSLNLQLNQIEFHWINDRVMALLDVVFGDLAAVVHYHFLRQEIRYVGLLQDRSALVLLIGQNALNGRKGPGIPTPGRWDAFLCEKRCDEGRRLAFKKEPVDAPDDLCFACPR